MNIKDTKLILDYLREGVQYKECLANDVHKTIYNCIEMIKILESEDMPYIKIDRMLNLFESSLEKDPVRTAINYVKARKTFDNRSTNIIVSGLQTLKKIEDEVNSSVFTNEEKVNKIAEIISDFKYENGVD